MVRRAVDPGKRRKHLHPQTGRRNARRRPEVLRTSGHRNQLSALMITCPNVQTVRIACPCGQRCGERPPMTQVVPLRRHRDRLRTLRGAAQRRSCGLSALEFRLMSVFVPNRGRVLTRDQLLEDNYTTHEIGPTNFPCSPRCSPRLPHSARLSGRYLTPKAMFSAA
jgi:DNA-binding response OmpR family regulator